MIFAVFDVLLAVNMCINYSFFYIYYEYACRYVIIGLPYTDSDSATGLLNVAGMLLLVPLCASLRPTHSIRSSQLHNTSTQLQSTLLLRRQLM